MRISVHDWFMSKFYEPRMIRTIEYFEISPGKLYFYYYNKILYKSF